MERIDKVEINRLSIFLINNILEISQRHGDCETLNESSNLNFYINAQSFPA